MVYPNRSEKDAPPPRRRIRSESDRKKHAGWRSCPRCSKSVSTNGRNFYHHMQKCDPVFFADLIAQLDAAKKAPKIVAPSPSSSLTLQQRVQFLQQLCFLRIYDRVVDDVLKTVERTTRVLNKAVFESVRQAKRQQAPKSVFSTPPPYSPAPARRRFPPVPLPEQFASPMTVQREGRERQYEGDRYWEGRDTGGVLGRAGFSTSAVPGIYGAPGSSGKGPAVEGRVGGGGFSAGGMPFSSGRNEGGGAAGEGVRFSSAGGLGGTEGVGYSGGVVTSSTRGEPPSSSGVASSSGGGSSRPASAMSISSVINN